MRRWMLLIGLLLSAWAGPTMAQQRVRCESFNYQPQSCPVSDPQYVRLAERLGGRCTEGVDWSVERRGLLVRNGCRAVFEIGRPSRPDYGGGPYPGLPNPGYPGGGYPGGDIDRVTCQSWNYQPARCAMNTSRGVRIARVLGGECREGSTWSYDRGGVSVRGGCRAEFVSGNRPGIGGPGFGGYPDGGPDRVTCQSWNYQPARCAMNTSRGVHIARVLGGDCREGATWDYDRGSVSVRGGCRADFVSGGRPGGGGPGFGGGQVIECSSWDYRPARCPVAVARDVELIRVLGGECIERRSWFWDRRGIDVRDGCRARFRVY